MIAKRFSTGLAMIVAAAFAVGAAAAQENGAARAAPALQLAQSTFKETPLDDRPAVDREHGQPPARTSGPPRPPAVPPAPPLTRRAPPPDDAAPPARDVPPATRRSARTSEPPARDYERPRADDPPPRRAEPARPARRAPSERSAFYANCTQQCHLSCEAAFEACNGDASPANPACVRKLETCRVERCACRIR
jgi:hypothetical protein